MAGKEKAKKIINILKTFQFKMSQIDSAKNKLLTNIQTDQDQAKLEEAKNKLKNL